MTNAEKFEEVFGFEHDNHCPYKECKDPEGDDYEACEDCLNDFWECEYRGEPTKTDLISKEEALMALTGVNLPTDRDKLIALFDKRIKALVTVEAVPLSVIEDIKAEINTRRNRSITLFKADGLTKQELTFSDSAYVEVLGIIDKAVSEVTYDKG